mmetsp:Transcript_34803/g.68713  ORF Transcript_34803/g.68713 Transcript_34803/m.68713 type:complete len:489 (-) Transcript_34803:118-1584(-)
MREDWPHLDILADKQALLGTDSRLKLIEAVLFDIRRRFDELNEPAAHKPSEELNASVTSVGEMLRSVDTYISQQKQTEPNAPPTAQQGKKRFPAPPIDNTDSLCEDVEFLRHSLEDDRIKWEREMISVQQRMHEYEESNKRFTESQRVQQSVLDSCFQRLENCEDMRASIQKLTDAEVEICGRLEEVRRDVDNCLAKQRTLREERFEPNDAKPVDGPELAKDVDPLLARHVTKLSSDVASVSERLTGLELCMQGTALDRQDHVTASETLVQDVRRMQLAIATISRSVSKLAKDVFETRRVSSELTTRSPTAQSLGGSTTQGGAPGQQPGIPNADASSVVDIDRLPEKSPRVEASPSALSLSIRSPAIRTPYVAASRTWLRPDRAPANERLASDASTSTRFMPPRNTNTETPSTSSLDSPARKMVAARVASNRLSMARGALSAVPEDPRSADLGAMTIARKNLNEPAPADRFSLRPRLSVWRQRLPHPT